MTDLYISLAVATFPVVVLFTYVYLKDKHEPEPLKYLVVSFIFGIVIALPAVYLELNLAEQTGFDSGPNVLETLGYAMIVVSAVEEGLKYLVLRLYMYRKSEFDEPYDGIMYAVAVSLGFAFIENILYVMEGGVSVGLLRMFTAVPGHAMFGVLMGYFVGMAKFREGNGSSAMLHLLGLGSAILVHGLYDFFLMLEDVQYYVPLLAFVVLIIGIVMGRKAIVIHQEKSPHSPDVS